MENFKFSFSASEQEVTDEYVGMLVEAIKTNPTHYALNGVAGAEHMSLDDIMKEKWFVERLVNYFLYGVQFKHNRCETISAEIIVGDKVFTYDDIKI